MTAAMDPLAEFQKTVETFATGKRRAIRNPFVIVPLEPALERRVSQELERWASTHGDDPGIETVHLDRIFPETPVFETVTSLPTGTVPADSITQTLRDNLAQEIVECILDEHEDLISDERQVLLLLNLGSLYPFARASELLDELDRRRVRATIGIPFPGRVFGGKLSFFGEDARHYYPAHRIDEQIREVYLQP